MAVRHANVPAGTDMDPIQQGLPGGRCPSPHRDTVREGAIRLLHAEGSVESVGAGAVHDWPAGPTDDAAFLEVEPMRQFSNHAEQVFG